MAAFSAALAAAAACTSSDTTNATGTSGGTTSTTTGGTTTTSSTSTSPSSGTGGSAPIVCDGSYTNVPKGECDLLNQDCGPGMTCWPAQVSGAWTTKCQAAPGLKGAGSLCTANSECEAGLFCIGPQDMRQCIPACCRTTDEPCGGGQCNLEVSFDNSTFLYMCTYAQQCTLLTMDACPAGTECHVEDPQQGLASCSPPSDQQVDEGGPCEFINDCKDMQNCTTETPGDGGAPAGVCRYYCYVSAGGTGVPGLGGCPAGQSCLAVDLGIPDIGLCRP